MPLRQHEERPLRGEKKQRAPLRAREAAGLVTRAAEIQVRLSEAHWQACTGGASRIRRAQTSCSHSRPLDSGERSFPFSGDHSPSARDSPVAQLPDLKPPGPRPCRSPAPPSAPVVSPGLDPQAALASPHSPLPVSNRLSLLTPPPAPAAPSAPPNCLLRPRSRPRSFPVAPPPSSLHAPGDQGTSGPRARNSPTKPRPRPRLPPRGPSLPAQAALRSRPPHLQLPPARPSGPRPAPPRRPAGRSSHRRSGRPAAVSTGHLDAGRSGCRRLLMALGVAQRQRRLRSEAGARPSRAGVRPSAAGARADAGAEPVPSRSRNSPLPDLSGGRHSQSAGGTRPALANQLVSGAETRKSASWPLQCAAAAVRFFAGLGLGAHPQTPGQPAGMLCCLHPQLGAPPRPSRA